MHSIFHSVVPFHILVEWLEMPALFHYCEIVDLLLQATRSPCKDFGGGMKGWMRVQHLHMNKYIPLVSCDSNLHLCTVSSSVYSRYLLSTYSCGIRICHGVRNQAFFDVVSIALSLALTRDDSFSGLESLTLIALSCNPKLSPAGQQTTKHDGLTLCLVNRASLC